MPFGGDRERPRQIWLNVVFPKAISIRGVRVLADARPGTPLPKAFRVQVRNGDAWLHFASAVEPQDASVPAKRVTALETEAIRVLFLTSDLPRSGDPQHDGIVRIRELLLLTPDGKEFTIPSLFTP